MKRLCFTTTIAQMLISKALDSVLSQKFISSEQSHKMKQTEMKADTTAGSMQIPKNRLLILSNVD